VTALYVVRLREGARGNLAEVRVRWLDPVSREATERAATIAASDVDGSFGGGSPRLQVCYAAAFFAETLRHSPYASAVRLADLASVASTAYDVTDDPQVGELADLIRRAARQD
jgi:Ca-activated chloride channel family protein